MRYSPTDAHEPFAFPDGFHNTHNDPLDDLGDRFHKGCIEVMRAERIGLIKLYNRLHIETERDPRIQGLCALQREIDIAVARAYGWDDHDHGLHEVAYLPENDRVRFTISEAARIEVMRRLSELSLQRYEEEAARGLHDGRATNTITYRPRT